MPLVKKSLLILLLLVAAFCGATAWFAADETALESKPLADGTAPAQRVTVYVSGEVPSPGVVTLAADARIEQAVAACGGLMASADAQQVNLAAPLADGMQIRVPARAIDNVPSGATPRAAGVQATDATASASGASVMTGKSAEGIVHLNTADASALDTLPGIGPVMAKRILEYRAQHGPFQRIEDLQKVRGIGSSRFAKIKDRLAL